jgi:hypothetical protein
MKLRYFGVIAAAGLLGLLVALMVINSITNRPKAVEAIVVVSTTTTSIQVELIPPLTVTAPVSVLTDRATIFVLSARANSNAWVDSMTDVELVGYARDVCDDFDRKLWFWDMYDTRLAELAANGWASEADATALQVVMADSVNQLCLYNQDRLPSELLGD